MTTDADLEPLAWKFLDQCELTADQSQEGALELRMFLFRFLGWLKRQEMEPRSHTSYCNLPVEHEGRCSMKGRGEVVQFKTRGKR